jgi:hypothetical protein
MYVIQYCFICRPSDSTVSEDAGIEPRTVATARRSNHSAIDLIQHSIMIVKTCHVSKRLLLQG